MGGAVFGEEDDSLFVPVSARFQIGIEPVEDGLGLRVHPVLVFFGPFGEAVEHGTFRFTERYGHFGRHFDRFELGLFRLRFAPGSALAGLSCARSLSVPQRCIGGG